MTDPLDGAAPYRDVLRYQRCGVHRFGSPGAEDALDWIAAELRDAGLTPSSQAFRMPANL